MANQEIPYPIGLPITLCCAVIRFRFWLLLSSKYSIEAGSGLDWDAKCVLTRRSAATQGSLQICSRGAAYTAEARLLYLSARVL